MKTHPAHVPTQAEATEAVRALFARQPRTDALRIADGWAEAWDATGLPRVASAFRYATAMEHAAVVLAMQPQWGQLLN